MMKNIACLLFVLFLHSPMHAQGEKGQDSVPTDKKDTSAINEVLETAYLLAAIGKYEDAHAYFVFVLRTMQDKQVFNNAGIVAVMDALNYFRPAEPEVKFHYPIELDLKSVGKRDLKDFTDVRTQKLRDAVAHFDAAIQLDTAYAPAYLNRACAYTLLGELEKARSEAERAAALPGYDKTTVDVQVLTGILQARQGNEEKAKASFESAVKKNSKVAEYNLMKLQGRETPVDSGKLSLLDDVETIDNISLADPSNIPEPDPESEITLNPQIRLYHNLHPGPNSRFYFSDNIATGQQTFFLLTGPEYSGTVNKLRIGASQAEIDTAYGAPLRSIETTTGQMRVYSSVILILDSGGKLVRWAIWGEDG